MRFAAAAAILEARKGAIVNTILFATDGSPSAQKALHEAIELAKATGWRLRVLTVWQAPLLAAYGYTPAAYVPELADAEREHATEVARAAVAAAVQAGIDATAETREGSPAVEICEAAAEMGARLIVLGAHGWGAVKRVLFGSVSTHVMHTAPCAVLVVRMTDGEFAHAQERAA
jgi:nucleotide-binding universal stress UspA family protein